MSGNRVLTHPVVKPVGVGPSGNPDMTRPDQSLPVLVDGPTERCQSRLY